MSIEKTSRETLTATMGADYNIERDADALSVHKPDNGNTARVNPSDGSVRVELAVSFDDKNFIEGLVHELHVRAAEEHEKVFRKKWEAAGFNMKGELYLTRLNEGDAYALEADCHCNSMEELRDKLKWALDQQLVTHLDTDVTDCWIETD